MRCRDLGALAVERDGVAHGLGGRRVETVLAALLVHREQPLSAARLVDLVWSDDAPPRAAAALDSLVWRLRRVLEPGVPASTSVLARDDRGFRLDLDPADVDSEVFLADAERVRALTDEGDPGLVAVADRALHHWRGRPYDGVPDGGWLDPVRARLEEAHAELHRRRLDALVAAGHVERALDDLVPVLAEAPLREGLWATRMLALYRAGRQADALDAFTTVRGLLDAELGLEPGPELRRLQARILAQDPALEAAPTPAVVDTGPLPGRRHRLVGREAEREALVAALAAHRLVTVTGPPGCGKTRLAVEAAEDRRADVDGVSFVDLAQVADPAAVGDRVAAALGAVPGPASALATMLRDRALLVVLDNCEHVAGAVADTVELLLDAGPKITVLATSRGSLDVDDERVVRLAPLPGPAGSSLAALTASDAVRLLLERAGHPGAAALSGADREAVAAVCLAVDGLPLGLELAAARADVFTWAEIADGLARDPGALTRPGRGPRHRRSLRDNVAWSLAHATPAENALHRRLSVLPGPFTLDAAVAVGRGSEAVDVTVADVPDVLGVLVHRSLVLALGPARPGGPSRFRQLTTVQAHGADALAAAGEAEATVASRDRWIADRVAGGVRLGRPGQRAWYRWLDDRLPVVRAAVEGMLAGDDPVRAALTVTRLAGWCSDRLHAVDGLRWAAAARACPGLPPVPAALAVLAGEALLAAHQQQRDATADVEGALAVLTGAVPDALTADRAASLVEYAAALWVGDAWADALRVAEVAESLAAGDAEVVRQARAVRAAAGVVLGEAGAPEAARAVVDDAPPGHASILAGVALLLVAAAAGDAPGALAWTGRVLRDHVRAGRADVGDVLEQRGTRWAMVGERDVAVRSLAASSAFHGRLGRGWPRHPGTAELVAELREAMDAGEFARCWGAGGRVGARAAARSAGPPSGPG